jgi:acyl carrier protein
MSEDILTQMRVVIEDVAKKDIPELTFETEFSDLPIDSLDMFTVIAALEDSSGRALSDDEFGQMETIGDMVRFFQGGK